MGWHRNYAEELTDLHNEMKSLLEEKDLEIAELRHENAQLKEILAAHSVHAHSPELEDYKRMHVEEQ